ncbi:MAG TPA: DMT family transporter [Acidimicrobiales bacterium]|nr:DMT family transporter [Acidimicrobiales bacterium]
MVIILALLTAFANAVASICQRLGVEDAPSATGPSMGLVRHMLRRPIWILGFVIMALGYGSQAVALHLGALNVVQPLLVSELVILVIVLWFWFSTPMRPRDFAAAFAAALGLGAFLILAAPTVGTKVPTNGLWFAVTLSTVVCVLLFVVLARGGPAWRQALLLGAGASIGFALLSAITKSMTDVLVVGWGALFSSWQLYALCVIGLCSFVIMQSAFRVGPFAASQSTLILVNPFVSILVGHVLFGEELRGGPLFVSLEVLSLLVMVVGALGLSTSALMTTLHDAAPDTHLLKGRGRYARWRSRAARTVSPGD